MKFLKKYESFNKYDYIMLNLDAISKENKEHGYSYYPKDNFGQIIDINEEKMYPYLIELSNGETIRVNENEIKRKLNLQEIKIYKIKKDQIKFNI